MTFTRTVVICALAALAACGGNGDSLEPPDPSGGASSSSSSSTGSSSTSSSSSSSSSTSSGGGSALERVSNASCLAPDTTPGDPDGWQLVQAFPDLPEISSLVGLFQSPGDDSRWYGVRQSGQVVTFVNDPAVDSVETWLNISNQVRFSGERGLLGFAFHPQFARNGYFYVSYIDRDSPSNSVISRFEYTGSTPVSAATEEVILRLSQPAGNHNGGGIGFGPDGYLYIGFGDGGGQNDQFNHGQNTETLHSAMLRIDVDSGDPYAVPSDNPFVGDRDVRPEIYAYGFRNPWRWSFDIQNGDLWLADVGQNAYEEVNRVDSGENFGWPIMEASSCFGSNTCDQSGLTLPVAEYPHQGGDCSVTGGFVYRGTDEPALQGSYIFADYCSGRIRRTIPDGSSWQTEVLLNAGRNIAAFGQSNSGEVYALDLNGGAGDAILRFESEGGGEPSMPENLSDTGCFADTEAKTTMPGVVPYVPSSVLWSDGADKGRFFAIPDGAELSLQDDGDMTVPQGSILIKHFIRDQRYLETRLLVHHDSGWRGYSYEWNEQSTDAVLLSEGKTVDYGEFSHIFPSPQACFSCHTGAANVALGVEASQLQLPLQYDSGVRQVQHEALAAAGYLDRSVNEDMLFPLPGLDDAESDIETRARSYLHSNCSSCHRPGGSGALVDLRASTSLSATGTCDEVPATGDLGINDARIIAPGAAERSVLLVRMSDLGEARMPPLASDVVDEDAVALIESWINSIGSCD